MKSDLVPSQENGLIFNIPLNWILTYKTCRLSEIVSLTLFSVLDSAQLIMRLSYTAITFDPSRGTQSCTDNQISYRDSTATEREVYSVYYNQFHVFIITCSRWSLMYFSLWFTVLLHKLNCINQGWANHSSVWLQITPYSKMSSKEPDVWTIRCKMTFDQLFV